MEALLLLGFFGFSSNSLMEPSSLTIIRPKRLASSHGTSSIAMVQAASCFL